MIKIIDVSGSLIVLSSYSFLAFYTRGIEVFVVVPLFFGIAVSIAGLKSHTGKNNVKLYQLLVVAVFGLAFLSYVLFAPLVLFLVYTAPAILASSSLIIAYRAKNNLPESTKRKGAPF